MSKLDGMNNRVDLWKINGSLLHHVGSGETFQEGEDLFAQVCLDYTSHNITLRQGARVIKERPRTSVWSEKPITEAEWRLSQEAALKVFRRFAHS